MTGTAGAVPAAGTLILVVWSTDCRDTIYFPDLGLLSAH